MTRIDAEVRKSYASILPDIDIAMPGPPEDFLDSMADIGRASGRFDVERRTFGQGTTGINGANFRLRDDGPHQDLSFQLLTRGGGHGRVEVEIRAHRWRPDPPTRAIYVEAARSMLAPLLMAFNRGHQTRIRLRVEVERAGAFRPSDRTQKLLEQFVICANTASLHPLDWKRFYRLVLEGRQVIPAEHLCARLTSGGFASAKAEMLTEIYKHLWALKKLR